MADSQVTPNNSNMIAVGVIVVLVIAVAAVMYRSKNTEEVAVPTPAVTNDAPTGMMMASSTVPTTTGVMTGTVVTSTTMAPPATEEVSGSVNTAPQATKSEYKDGTYGADGEYISPAGQEHVGVTITLKNDVITAVTFEGRATSPMSKRFQGMFESGYKTLVIGKKIEDVRLDKVSGSSLTPKGFNDAIDQVKAAAQV